MKNPFKWTVADYQAEAEFHKARADSYEEKIEKLIEFPSRFISQIASDRAYEAKYRAKALAEQSIRVGQ